MKILAYRGYMGEFDITKIFVLIIWMYKNERKNNRCLLQQRLFKNFSSLLHFALDFQIIFGFQFFYQVFSDYLFVQHQLLAVVDVS